MSYYKMEPENINEFVTYCLGEKETIFQYAKDNSTELMSMLYKAANYYPNCCANSLHNHYITMALAELKLDGIKACVKLPNQIYTEIEEYELMINKLNTMSKFDLRENFYFDDFLDKWDGKEILNTFEFLYDLQRVYIYIRSQGDEKYAIKSKIGDPIQILKSRRSHTFNFLESKGRELKLKSYNIRSLHKKFPGAPFIYNYLIFKPYSGLDDTPKGMFNLFRGFKARDLGNYDIEKIKWILYHIEEVFASGDDEWNKWILSFFALQCKFPGKKLGKVLALFHDIHGIGKSTFLAWICEYMFGDRYFVEGPSLDVICDKFNSILHNKLFIVVNEASTDETQKRMSDKLKGLITDKYYLVEKKFQDKSEENNHLNMVILSNNYDSIKIEESDRRYAIAPLSDKYKDNVEYFENLCSYYTQDTADHFYTFLLQYEAIDITATPIPHSDLKETIIWNALSTPVQFITEFLTGLLPVKTFDILGEIWLYDGFILKDSLYQLYINWALKIRKMKVVRPEYNHFFKQIHNKIARFEKRLIVADMLCRVVLIDPELYSEIPKHDKTEEFVSTRESQESELKMLKGGNFAYI